MFALLSGALFGGLTVILLRLPVLAGVAMWMAFYAGGAATTGYLAHQVRRGRSLRL